MKNFALFFAVILVFALIPLGCSTNPSSPNIDGQQLETSFWNAVKNNDITKIEKIMDDNFLSVYTEGKRDKKEALDYLTSVELNDFELTNFVTTQNGNVVNVTYHAKVNSDNVLNSSSSMHASTWIYSNSKWLLSAHSDLSRFSEKEAIAAKDLAANAVTVMGKSISQASKHIENQEDFINYIRSSVNSVRFYDDKSGYFFVYDTTGTNIAHGNQKDLVGKNLIDYQDCKGLFVLQEMINMLREKQSGFIKYHWLNPVTQKEEPKLGFIMLIPGTPYFIGDGIYK